MSTMRREGCVARTSRMMMRRKSAKRSLHAGARGVGVRVCDLMRGNTIHEFSHLSWISSTTTCVIPDSPSPAVSMRISTATSGEERGRSQLALGNDWLRRRVNDQSQSHLRWCRT